MPLHMTKIAYRSGSLENLRKWVEAGEEAHMTTRYLPKRHEEMIGGSLYWILEHAIVASIGGNAGTQTMAVSVRALAMNQLTRSNTRRILWRELRVALLNGATVAALIGVATALIFTPLLGGVIALAVVINIFTAGLAGVAVPVLFDRMGQDPAVASSVFVTMITDSMGFFAFLGLAVASGLVG